MKKKQNKQNKIVEKNDKPQTLGDLLNADVLNELKERKKQLQNEEEKKREEEEERKRHERKMKEKNKSFEELLNESEFDWHKFK